MRHGPALCHFTVTVVSVSPALPPALPMVDQHDIGPHAKFIYLEVIRWERHSEHIQPRSPQVP